ncbi:DUF397 domain-containing protein [Actinocorallia sp. A-T 12471]|uniref:DUF397 domain-containing protein n=1 Tax=Actinocorallia sp. A-T 12471 TaxID=3089813 RepID=UPI0029CB04BA|nr:DUF397 domain-containing protein [Actinocorallia sp. A-T 12471]MDX6744351.1 DUF397 domain-containing protein [Actinocorallia sp. A-T 12471]
MESPLWRRSSYTGSNGGNCVELARAPRTVLARDSKHPHRGHLTLTPHTSRSLLTAIKSNTLNP